MKDKNEKVPINWDNKNVTVEMLKVTCHRREERSIT